jgi:hypothetical protein
MYITQKDKRYPIAEHVRRKNNSHLPQTHHQSHSLRLWARNIADVANSVTYLYNLG